MLALPWKTLSMHLESISHNFFVKMAIELSGTEEYLGTALIIEFDILYYST